MLLDADLLPWLLFRFKFILTVVLIFSYPTSTPSTFLTLIVHLQARDEKAFKSALDEEEFDVEKKHLVDGVDSTLLQVGLFWRSRQAFDLLLPS